MERIAYITVKAPFGEQETFIITEMLALRDRGVDLLIVPRDSDGELFHEEAASLTGYTLNIPWLSTDIVKRLAAFICRNPRSFFRIIEDTVLKAGRLKTALKNLVVLPKAIYLSAVLRDASVSHIHAHWASTPSTMAYVISEITGIPWSFTAHRGDIAEDNILRRKCAAASFVRAIDEGGRREISAVANDPVIEKKILTVHMGVGVPEAVRRPAAGSREVFTILCPANFVPKKGHRYLIECCRLLSARGVGFRCLIAGDGPLREELQAMVEGLPPGCDVRLLGRLPHERLLGMYEEGAVDAVVLPSIVTDEGVKEGIPVALIEAMSYGIPVVSTCTGGIPELIGDGSGVMVGEKDVESLAAVIERLARDPDYYSMLSRRGRRKIETDFNISTTVDRLLDLFSGRGRST